MKLNKIAYAVSIACLALSSSAAWSDPLNAPDASAGVTATSTTVGGVPVNASNGLTVAGPLTTAAGVAIGTPVTTNVTTSTLSDGAGSTATASRADVATGVSQKTTVFTTPTVANGSQTGTG